MSLSREKIRSIEENGELGLYNQINLLLVIAGKKPGTSFSLPLEKYYKLYNQRILEETIAFCDQLDLRFTVDKNEDRFGNKITDFNIAKYTKTLTILQSGEIEEVGHAYGFPQTAIDAFLGRIDRDNFGRDKREPRVSSILNGRPLSKMDPFTGFFFSADHFLEEYKSTSIKWHDTIKELSPYLYDKIGEGFISPSSIQKSEVIDMNGEHFFSYAYGTQACELEHIAKGIERVWIHRSIPRRKKEIAKISSSSGNERLEEGFPVAYLSEEVNSIQRARNIAMAPGIAPSNIDDQIAYVNQLREVAENGQKRRLDIRLEQLRQVRPLYQGFTQKEIKEAETLAHTPIIIIGRRLRYGRPARGDLTELDVELIAAPVECLGDIRRMFADSYTAHKIIYTSLDNIKDW